MTVSRRQLGRGAAAGVVAAAAAGCGIQTGPDPAAQTTARSYRMDFGPRPPRLPTGGATMRLLSGGPGGKSAFFRQLVPNYRRARRLTVAYDELPNDKIAEVLPLQLRNGQADDVFQPAGLALNAVAAAGQVLPLDEVIEDFPALARQLPFGVLVPGVNQFDGRTYAVSPSTNRRLTGYLIYGTEAMARAGYAPTPERPLSWSELRRAAARCTTQGRGKYYGLMLGSNPPDTLGAIVLEIAQCAGGLVGNGINWRSGHYNYADQAVVAAIELFRALQADGSLFPGWISTTDQVARARMALGQGAMLLNGPWNYAVWAQQNPTFRYAVAPAPLADPRRPGTVGYTIGGGNSYSVFARSHPAQRAMAGDILRYLMSADGQLAWGLLVGSSDPAWSDRALHAAAGSDQLSDVHRQTFAMYDRFCRLLPSPMIRNPDTGQVALELAPVHPSFGELFQGIMLGQVSNVAKALRDLDSRSEQALEQAIQAAGRKGARVSRDDWRFPDWDPHRDYSPAHYAARS